jgi:hypothetical protein
MDANQINVDIDNWQRRNEIPESSNEAVNRIKKIVKFLESKGQSMESDYNERQFSIWTQPPNIGILVHIGINRNICKIDLSFSPNEDGRDVWRGEFQESLHTLFGYEFLTVEGDGLEKFDYEKQLEKLLQIAIKFSTTFPMIKAILAMLENGRARLKNDANEMLKLISISYDEVINKTGKEDVPC